MRRIISLSFAIAALGATEGSAQQAEPVDSLEARVWLDRGEEPVVEVGDDVRVYYRTSRDAFAAIFRIDTDGVISMLFPEHPEADGLLRGGRDYRLLFPNSPTWRVEEDPGVGYFFMVASPEPFDFSSFGFDETTGWDLGPVGAVVYEDPYVAIDEYVAAILPDWEFIPYGLDFLTYNVGDTHDYPRFICYDCHGFRSYSSWNPYVLPCDSYRVVIWDDPYFYPRYRYSGSRVVFGRPFGPRPRYGVTARVRGANWAPVVRTRPAPARRVVEYKEPPRARSFQPRNPVPRVQPRPTQLRPTPSRTGSARSRPSLQRRPSAGSSRTPAGRPAAGSSARGTTQRGTANRGTTSRGTTSRGTTTRRPTAAPNRGSAQGRAVSPPRSQPRATPRRAPTRAVPRSRPATGNRAAPSRPPRATGSRAAPSRPPRATGSRPATSRPPRATGSRPATSRPPRATGGRPATSRPPRATGSRPAPSRPPRATGSRPPSRPAVRSAPRAPARARPTTRRRPTGRGRGG